MNIIVISLLLLFVLFIVTLIIKQIKNKKNIGQKISFLYNQLYIIMIIGFYDSLNKKQFIKEELVDYYKNVVSASDLDNKMRNGQDIKQFILQYYNANSKLIEKVYDLIDMYYNKYYISVEGAISKLVYLLVVVILFTMFLIYISK